MLPIIMALVILFLPVPANAQELTYEKAYQDYLHAQDVYSKEHNEYLLARSQYQQAKTLAAETKAREETSQMLIARDEVIRTYLQAVRMDLIETPGMSDTTKNGLSTRLEAEINWYQDHSNRVTSAGTLRDLEQDSQEAKKHYDTSTTRVVYETLIVIPVTVVAELRKQITTIVGELKEFINLVEDQGTHDVSNAGRLQIFAFFS